MYSVISVLVLALSSSAHAAAKTAAQQGQDFYFGQQQAGHYITLQQQGSSQQGRIVQPSDRLQTYNNFYSPGVFQQSSFQQPRQQAQETNAPTPFQLPPRSSLQQFDPYQPFHTNQHLPQPFQNHQSGSGFEVRPFHSDDYYFEPENKDLRTTQSYFNVQHRLVDSIDNSARWPKKPGVVNVNFRDDGSIPIDQSTPRAGLPLSSTQSIFQSYQDETRRFRIPEQQPGRLATQRSRPVSISTTTPLPSTTVPSTEHTFFRETPDRSRSRYKNIRLDSNIKPTTYTPSSTPSIPVDRSRQRSRFTRPQANFISAEVTPTTTEFGKPLSRRVTSRLSYTAAPTVRPSRARAPTTASTTEPPYEYEFEEYELTPEEPIDDPDNVGPPASLTKLDFDYSAEPKPTEYHEESDHYSKEKNVHSYESTEKVYPTTYRASTTPRATTTATTTTTTSTTTSRPEPVTVKEADSNQVKAPPKEDQDEEEGGQPTESWVIVASVQTSRSVSGARFLPSDFIKQEEVPLPRSPSGGIVPKPEVTGPEEVPTTTPAPTEPTTTTTTTTTPKPTTPPSTESIIDKLDRIQSEVSSGIFTGFRSGENKLELADLPDMVVDNVTVPLTTATSTSPSTTTTSTTPPPTSVKTTTEEDDEPTSDQPVFVRKFVPASRRTTKSPVKQSVLASIQFDDLAGLLPPGFKARPTKRPSTTSTTTTTTTTPTPEKEPPKEEAKTRESGGRSSSSSFKNKIKFDDVSALLPPGYKTTTSVTTTTSSVSSSVDPPKGIESILGKVKFDDVSALLPPGFKSDKDASEVPSSLLPPGFKPVETVPSSLLPPGYKPSSEKTNDTKPAVDSILSKVKFTDASSLLPKGYSLSTSTPAPVEETSTASTVKVVFPSRPGQGRKPSSGSSPNRPKNGGVGPIAPKIQKGWPVRVTTEFTGWPTPSTTPIPIEKILAAAKAAAEAAATSTTTSTTTTTTTTTSTTTTPRPTTPGLCREDCNMAASIRLVGGAKWVPELLDQNTEEWRELANEVSNQLDEVYRSSESLSRWYKKITIDGFSEGSIIVDYVVELSELGRSVNTADMKRLFHESLERYTIQNQALTGDTSYTATEVHNGTVEYKLGKFLIDPKYTDFIVLPKSMIPTLGYAEEDELLPQWAIAVIVIGLASLLFVIIFGVTVLVNRHKSSKAKQPAGLTEDMLNELNKNHMGGLDNYGADDLYNMEDVWNEKPMKKVMRSSGSLHDNSMANLYDSWRSEWNGYYYNAYYGNGSSSGFSRRRSDYDTNF